MFGGAFLGSLMAQSGKKDLGAPYIENLDGQLAFVVENFYNGYNHVYKYELDMWGCPFNWGNTLTSGQPCFFGFYCPSDRGSSYHTRFYVQKPANFLSELEFAIGNTYPRVSKTDGKLNGAFAYPAAKHTLTLDYSGSSVVYKVDGTSICSSSIDSHFGTFTASGGILGRVSYDNGIQSGITSIGSSTTFSRVYGFRKWLDGELVLDYVPMSDSGGIGLKNRVDGTILRPHSGTGAFRYENDPSREKPYDAEVEYLRGTGTQWICTDVGGVNDLDFEIDAMLTTEGDNAFFGSIDAYTSSPMFCLVYSNTESAKVKLSYGTTSWHIWPTFGKLINERFTVKKTGNHVECPTSGVSYDVSSGSFDTMHEIELFARSSEFPGARHGHQALHGNIYSASFSIGQTKVGDFIPVRVGSGTSAVGYMYDKVSGKLYGNEGTGAFIIGPDKGATWTNPYVTDGLVAMWDGEWNSGIGGVHDPNATDWIDLVYGRVATRKGSGVSVTPNSMKISGQGYFDTNTDFNQMQTLTLEGCAKAWFGSGPTTQYGCLISSVEAGGIGYQLTGSSPHRWCFVQGSPSGGYYEINRVDQDADNPITLSMAVSPINGQIGYKNGQRLFSVPSATAVRYSGYSYCIGSDASAEGISRGYAYGDFYNIRVYNRALTAEEIAHNNEVDRQRFKPKEIVPVQYVRNVSLSQYIDTGVRGSSEIGFYVKATGASTDSAKANSIPLGCGSRERGASGTDPVLAVYTYWECSDFYGLNGEGGRASTLGDTRLGNDIGEYYGDKNKREIYKNGILIASEHTAITTPFTMEGNIILFNFNTLASVNNGIVSIMEVKLYDNEELVRHFIPVKFYNENGVYEGAMYDMVEKKLYRNAGTGTISYGPEDTSVVI